MPNALKKTGWFLGEVGGSNACPACGVTSISRHSHYVRRIQDLPDEGTPVTLSVQLDRWRCLNRSCKRQTFAGQLPPIIASPFARRTNRVLQLVRQLGHAAGGRPAERLMAPLGMPVSNDTNCAI